MRGFRLVVACLAALCAPALTAAVPAAARDGIGMPIVIGCPAAGNAQFSDAAIGVDGTIRGFTDTLVGCPTPTPVPGAPMMFFTVSPTGVVVHEASPYHGRVLRVAWDGQGSTYVLFSSGTSISIGKHLDSGVFAPSTTLSRTAPQDFLGNSVSHYPAALTAAAGHWWAVWGEQNPVAPPPPHSLARYQLFGAHTLLGHRMRARITTLPATEGDTYPDLAYRPGQVTLLWTRAFHVATPTERSVLRIATSTGENWQSRQLTGGGVANYGGALAVYNGATYVSWVRTSDVQRLHPQILYASNLHTGSRFTPIVAYSRLTVGEPAFTTTIAVSGSTVFIAFSQAGAVVSGTVVIPRRHFVAGMSGEMLRIMAQGSTGRLLYAPQNCCGAPINVSILPL